jgi:hypothetical protein
MTSRGQFEVKIWKKYYGCQKNVWSEGTNLHEVKKSEMISDFDLKLTSGGHLGSILICYPPVDWSPHSIVFLAAVILFPNFALKLTSGGQREVTGDLIQL